MITNELQRHLPSLEFLERELQLPLLWGTIRCYSYIADGEEGLSPLMNLLSALEDLLMIETGKTFAYCRLLYFLCRSDIFWYNELALGKLLRRLYWDLAPLVLIILVNVQLSTQTGSLNFCLENSLLCDMKMYDFIYEILSYLQCRIYEEYSKPTRCYSQFIQKSALQRWIQK